MPSLAQKLLSPACHTAILTQMQVTAPKNIKSSKLKHFFLIADAKTQPYIPADRIMLLISEGGFKSQS